MTEKQPIMDAEEDKYQADNEEKLGHDILVKVAMYKSIQSNLRSSSYIDGEKYYWDHCKFKATRNI